MAEAKKASQKTVMDVTRPGKSAPTQTAKPVLVTNRLLLKDPMMQRSADDDDDAPAPTPSETLAHAGMKSVKPIETAPEPEIKAEATPPASANQTSNSSESDNDTSSGAELTAQQLDAEAEEQNKQAAAVQKLIETKTYFLPINSVEKRRSKRFVLLGVLLSIVLAIAWVDIALDASIIQLGSVKPVTHFFSN